MTVFLYRKAFPLIIYRVLFLKVRTLNTFLDFDVCVYFFSDRICTLLKQIWFFFNSGNFLISNISSAVLVLVSC